VEKEFSLKELLDYHNTPELVFPLRPGLSIHGIMKYFRYGLLAQILLNKNSQLIEIVIVILIEILIVILIKIITEDIFVEEEFILIKLENYHLLWLIRLRQ